MRDLRALFLTLFLVSCGSVRPPPVPVEPDDTEACAAACLHLDVLGCPEGQPLEDGTSCTRFCVDTQVSGHALRPSCVMRIESCDQLQQCQEQ